MFPLAYECMFGRDVLHAPAYVSGWSAPEDGFTWTVGKSAEMDVRLPAPANAYLLELHVSPCVRPDIYPTQRIHVRANGVTIGSAIARDHTVLGFIIPGYLVSDRLRLRFDTPDAVNVRAMFGAHDDRTLGFMFSRVALSRIEDCPPPVIAERHDNLFAHFESIGDNCEFGIVQRKSGLDPLGLFRFSGQPLRFIVKALNDQFRAFADAASIRLVKTEAEYAVFFPPYHMHYHTFIKPDGVDEAALVTQQSTRLRFLARKFTEDAQGGEKIFVVKKNGRLETAEILPIFAALNRIGRTNMLAVRPATSDRLEGHVDVIMPGLFVGYINEFAQYGNPQVHSLDGWRKVCRSVLELVSP